MHFLNVGFGNFVAINRVLTVITPESAPIKRYIAKLRAEDMLMDLTFGKTSRSLIVLDNGQAVLSPVHPETIVGRVEKIH